VSIAAEMIAVRHASPAAEAARAPRRSAHEVRALGLPVFGGTVRPPGAPLLLEGASGPGLSREQVPADGPENLRPARSVPHRVPLIFDVPTRRL